MRTLVIMFVTDLTVVIPYHWYQYGFGHWEALIFKLINTYVVAVFITAATLYILDRNN